MSTAAVKSGMSEKTARKYVRLGRPPSQLKSPRSYKTRPDVFAEMWPEVEALLTQDPSLQALTLFEHLCRTYPGRFRTPQLRTLQRRVKIWRAREGAPREVFFPQEHVAGRQAQSDFTYMQELEVTMAGQPFDHMFYHFTLTYSNWEWGGICFSESFEALAEGLQAALWHVGGVPIEHRTDSLTAAVTLLGGRDKFTDRYEALLDHYGMDASHTNTGKGNENGDVEQSHYRFKTAVAQELKLRGSNDFLSRGEYEKFLRRLLERRNQQRGQRVREDLAALRPLPEYRLADYTSETVKVTRNSTVLMRSNFYSVPSQLIGERVEVRMSSEFVEIWYAGQIVERCERLRGKGKHRIDYRHIIDSLVRKPGAFAHCRYQASLFPRLIFRVAYDWLREHAPSSADKQYVQLLEVAAKTGEEAVAIALRALIEAGEVIGVERVSRLVAEQVAELEGVAPQVEVEPVDLATYDRLLAAEPGEARAEWTA